MRAIAGVHATLLVLRGATGHEDRVVGMGLDMLLEILGTLERLAAKVTLVWLERHVDADMRRNVVALHSSGAARIPLARQVQVVGALAANVLLADVFLGPILASDSTDILSMFSIFVMKINPSSCENKSIVG
jgi:hypothetical protein